MVVAGMVLFPLLSTTTIDGSGDDGIGGGPGNAADSGSGGMGGSAHGGGNIGSGGKEGRATAICWAAAALMIAGWQATTKRVANDTINNQLLHEEEADHTSWLTPAFLVISKMTTRIFLESLSPILHPLSFFIFSPAYFASSQFFHPLNT